MLFLIVLALFILFCRESTEPTVSQASRLAAYVTYDKFFQTYHPPV